jgi:hypothetical protein
VDFVSVVKNFAVRYDNDIIMSAIKNTKDCSMSARIGRITRELSVRRARKQTKAEARGDFRHMTRPMRRKETPPVERVTKRLKKLIAYDLETTNIAKGTPRPLYITAYGADFWFSGEVAGTGHLLEILSTRFLLPEFSGCRFVAWNGNKFDVYLVALALLRSGDYVLRPYLTRSKNLRGLRVMSRLDEKISWEFLDGISMLMGSVPRTLAEFLKTFGPPELQKLEGPDFDAESFNPRNPAHVKYAERDSEGLYFGLEKARSIVLENFAIDLCPTIGNMGIKIFQRFIPKFVECWKPPARALKAIRDQVMRGGFCFCVHRYSGPVWKYDINQAYAAAMREAKLPAGRCVYSPHLHPYADVYIARVRAKNFANRIPFYYRDMEKGRSVFGLQEIGETWLTSIEIEQLQREGWKVEVFESWFWDSSFRMKEYVDRLEFLRVGEGRNPKDAQGEMVKAIGNNSYGKTVEQLDGLDLIMSPEQPEGFSPYPVDNETVEPGLELIWYKIGEPMLREYHQPQIGAFITAQVRMVVRRAALQNPDAWLYADTDCVMFREPVALDFDARRYGAWKIEAEGERYTIIAKKVYTSADGMTKHAKGMNVKKLTGADFDKWLSGTAPRQKQIQRQSFVKVISGFDMFIEREKVGENMENTRKRAAA